MSYLVTGASGFLGRRVMSLLREQPALIHLIVRAPSLPNARKLYGDWPNVRILSGDLREFEAGLETKSIIELADSVKTVLHMAASYDLGANASENYIHNIVGTQNLIALCDQLKRLENFVTTSTIAIAGNFSGIFHENMFNVGQSFPNPYAETKFRVEGLIGAWRSSVRKYVCRVGILVGEESTGLMDKVDGPYYLFRTLKEHRRFWKALSMMGRMPFPFSENAKMHIVPVDAVAKVLTHISVNPVPFRTAWRTYHLTGPALPLPDFLKRTFTELGYNTRLWPIPKGFVPAEFYHQLGMPPSLQHYMFSEVQFTNSTLREDYPDLSLPHFSDYADALYRYVRESL